MLVCEMLPTEVPKIFTAHATIRNADASCLLDMLSRDLTVDASIDGQVDGIRGRSHRARMTSVEITPSGDADVIVLMEIYAPDWRQVAAAA
jgi:hypothetical protein